jgi:hypothetical protein
MTVDESTKEYTLEILDVIIDALDKMEEEIKSRIQNLDGVALGYSQGFEDATKLVREIKDDVCSKVDKQ